MERITIYPRTTLSFGGVAKRAGEKAEVYDQNQIAAIGAEPAPEKYYRIDLHSGPKVVHNISDGAEWSLNVSEAEADEHVAGIVSDGDGDKHHKRGRKKAE